MIVGRCLTPALSKAERTELADVLQSGVFPWESLLVAANYQHCTPMWYVRLVEHGLLPHLPEDLQKYLAQLTEANRDRNRMLQRVLGKILAQLESHDIPVLLLKGAATFADNLYSDEGARLMSDMDLLIPKDQVRQSHDLLKANGFDEKPEDTRKVIQAPLDLHLAHLPGLFEKETKAKIELHKRIAYGESGRIFTVKEAWSSGVRGEILGHDTQWLCPTHRLLHNAAHATLPHMEFLRATVRLQDLAEFAALLNRYEGDIDLQSFWYRVRQHKCMRAVATYANVARLIMGAKIEIPSSGHSNFHTQRILSYNWQWFEPSADKAPRHALQNRLKRMLTVFYYYLNLPRWVWRNLYYGDEKLPIWTRLKYFALRLFDRQSREHFKFGG